MKGIKKNWWRVSLLAKWGELRQIKMVKITRQSTNMIEDDGKLRRGRWK